MKKNEIYELINHRSEMPIGCLVWKKKKSRISKETEVVSTTHNTKRYSISRLYKPISKIIDFNEK